MTNIIIYSAEHCPHCVRAKQLFDSRGLTYAELRIDEDPSLRQEMESKTGRRTVPQIYINDYHVGGADDLFALARTDSLEKLLNEE